MASAVPADGIVQISFPEDITVSDLASLPSKCSVPSDPSLKLVCTFERKLVSDTNESRVFMTVMNAFEARMGIKAQEEFDL